MPYSYSTVSTDYKGIPLHKCVEVLKSNLTKNSVNVSSSGVSSLDHGRCQVSKIFFSFILFSLSFLLMSKIV